MSTEKMIQGWQRSRIFGLARGQGMSTRSADQSDDLHQLIHSRTDKISLTDLTYDEAYCIIDQLTYRKTFDQSRTPVHKKFVFKETPGGMSEGQYKKVVALMCELRKLDATPSKATIEQRVAGIVRRELHITASEDSPYSWLTYRHGVKLIEIIKGYLDTARRKSEKGCKSG